jgi:gamma-glutamyl-gamma-aminobutyrate hydrolase PuuD
MPLPTIGLTCSRDLIRYGDWTEEAVFVPQTYVGAVARAGGRPLPLVPLAADAEDPADLLERLDGVIVTGGAGDVDPARYGAERHPQTAPDDPLRDPFELALVRGAAERDLPCLGICRGMQLINVAYGGVLEQHLPDALGHDEHRGSAGVFADHEVRAAPGSLAARAAGSERLAVRSFHHQGVARVGAGLTASAWAEGDGSVEAVEDERRRFLLGVLWHPEEDEADRLIGAFVAECRAALAVGG